MALQQWLPQQETTAGLEQQMNCEWGPAQGGHLRNVTGTDGQDHQSLLILKRLACICEDLSAREDLSPPRAQRGTAGRFMALAAGAGEPGKDKARG
jgi:hypothetical protein